MYSFASNNDELDHSIDENTPFISSNGVLEFIYDRPNEPQSNTSNEYFALQIRNKLRSEFPTKYVIFQTLFVIGLNASIIICERFQTDHFTLDDLNLVSYRTLDGIVILASITNITIAIVNFLTSKLLLLFNLKQIIIFL